MDTKKYRYSGEGDFILDDYDTRNTDNFKSSKEISGLLAKNLKEMAQLQDRLYAEGKVALLIIFQAMDAAGKDSAIKHVMSGINPQGVDVFSFKQPSVEELSHDYLWRAVKVLPARGKIAIFNRSYYEDVLVVKVHKLYEQHNLPDNCKDHNTIDNRYRQIRNFEEYLSENGIVTVKFFLHLSKDTQRKRFLQRIDKKDKNWKFSSSDIKERERWDDYQEAYQAAIRETSTPDNPWYIVPADKKWYSRAVISSTLLDVLKQIDPKYPTLSKEQQQMLKACKQELLDQN